MSAVPSPRLSPLFGRFQQPCAGAWYGFVFALSVLVAPLLAFSAVWPAAAERLDALGGVMFVTALFGGPIVGIALRLPFWSPSPPEKILAAVGMTCCYCRSPSS
jgi:hypothetical protein